jgi:hypothetical protein
MPRCHFDVEGKSVKRDQHGLECVRIAYVLGCMIGRSRPELLEGCYISVIEDSGREV